jgi:hypothetical protein
LGVATGGKEAAVLAVASIAVLGVAWVLIRTEWADQQRSTTARIRADRSLPLAQPSAVRGGWVGIERAAPANATASRGTHAVAAAGRLLPSTHAEVGGPAALRSSPWPGVALHLDAPHGDPPPAP